MDKRIKKAYDILQRSYQTKILLAELAAEVKLSPFFFQKLFKREMHESPSTCLNRIRLNRAILLIKINPGITMSEVAMDCGFSSPSVFSRAFQKRYHMSPVEFYKNSIEWSAREVSEEIEVSVKYFPGAKVFYNHTNYYDSDFLHHFEFAKLTCEKKKTAHKERLFGILTHASFHSRRLEPNYYAGVEITEKMEGDNIFEIPKGKYACFTTCMSYEDPRAIMVQFKSQWLDRHSYVVSDMFAFEIIDPSANPLDYPFIKREVYVPVKSSRSTATL